MYRLTGPNIFLFIFLLIIGAIITALIPVRFGTPRILSLTSLLIGEVGMSFLPVLALYPRATLVQAIILAVIYFLTTFTICFFSWGINNFSQDAIYAFLWKGTEFHVNPHALFVANLFSLLTLVTNFRLIYDEELTKEFHKKRTGYKYKPRLKFAAFEKPLLRRPDITKTEEINKPLQTTETKEKFEKKEKTWELEEQIGKPFEFEPDIEVNLEKLPEESSGKLFAQEAPATKEESEFFIDEETKVEKITHAKPFPPEDIKKDLQAIFEQYSSLNAIKKLTTTQIPSPTPEKKKKKEERKSRKPYEIPEEKPQISVHIEGQDIHDASFRQVTEAERFQEIKEELAKELQEKLQEKVNQETQKIEDTIEKTTPIKEEIIESIKTFKEELTKEFQEKLQERVSQEAQKVEDALQQTTTTKEEIIQSIKNIKGELIESLKEELTKEYEEKLQERVSQEAQKVEDALQQTTATKEEIIQSIQNIKGELIESLKEELKKELTIEREIQMAQEQKEQKAKEVEEVTDEKETKEITTEEVSEPVDEEEIELLKEKLSIINGQDKVLGSLILNKKGQVIAENWKDFQSLNENIDTSIIKAFNIVSNEVNKTNQGSLAHLLLESENGIMSSSLFEDKILAVYTNGTGEIYSGRLLKAIAELEEE